MNKLKRKRLLQFIGLTIIVSMLATSLAFLTIFLLLPEEHTIEYELTFDNAALQKTKIPINVEVNPQYYVEETYGDMKNATPSNNTIYVYVIEGCFESEGLGEKEEEIYNQVILFYYNENDQLIHYVKYEEPSRYDMTIDMNSTYIKITFKGVNI